MQVLQRYFTPHSAAMAEYALASAVINRVKSHRASTAEGSRLSPVQSIGDKEGTFQPLHAFPVPHDVEAKKEHETFWSGCPFALMCGS